MRPTHPIVRAQAASTWRRVALASLLCAVGSIATASADTYTVGAGTCSFVTIAAALTAAENHPGPDTIRLTRSSAYYQQAITFTTSQELTLTGGYADCTTATEDNLKTTLSGSGGAATSVLTIGGGAGSKIHIRKLTISGGDASQSDTNGGGISYVGSGILDIADTQISSNKGNYGGGINAYGWPNQGELDIGPGVVITGNTGYLNGGGVYSNEMKTVIRGDDSVILGNHALGSGSNFGLGGGLYIRACANDSSAYLSSGNFLGVISANDALHGGGVAIETPSGCTKKAELLMYSTSTAMTRISANSASISGGGLYILHNGGPAYGFAWNGSIQGNGAPVGAGMDLGNGGFFSFNDNYSSTASRPSGGVDCATGVPCGALSGNQSDNGPVVFGAGYNGLHLERVEVSGNVGTELIHVTFAQLINSLVAGNQSSGRLVESTDVSVTSSTVSGNQVAATEVFGVDSGGRFTLWDSIAWQPGKAILHNGNNYPSIKDVVVNEGISLYAPDNQHITVHDPRFIDPPHGDYRLTAASPAIDYTQGYPAAKDLLGLSHYVDLGFIPNQYGRTDVGAYERQTLQPLVENGDFAGNTNVWTLSSGSVASYDATTNAPGSVGGSLHIKSSTTANSVIGAVQCIHLPGPGYYAPKASGKVTSGTQANPHYAVLAWELRLTGNENCVGTIRSSGSQTMAATGTTWNRPTDTPYIIVPSDEWTSYTSIAVYLKISAGSIATPNGADTVDDTPTLKDGWLDRVTLTVDDPDDYIFYSGFEPK